MRMMASLISMHGLLISEVDRSHFRSCAVLRMRSCAECTWQQAVLVASDFKSNIDLESGHEPCPLRITLGFQTLGLQLGNRLCLSLSGLPRSMSPSASSCWHSSGSSSKGLQAHLSCCWQHRFCYSHMSPWTGHPEPSAADSSRGAQWGLQHTSLQR